MIDYIHWLLEEEEQEEAVAELSASTLPAKNLQEQAVREKPLTEGAQVEAAPVQEGQKDQVQGKRTLQTQQKMGLQPEVVAKDAFRTDEKPVAEENVQEGQRMERMERVEAETADAIQKPHKVAESLTKAAEQRRMAALYGAVQAGRRSTGFSKTFAVSRNVMEETPAAQSFLSADPAALDRCFERDARRYDGSSGL